MLRDRQIYNSEVWRFGCQHLDVPTIKEYLQSEPHFSFMQGHFKSELYETCPRLTFRGYHRFLEYSPMVNARAHAVGESKTILN